MTSSRTRTRRRPCRGAEGVAGVRAWLARPDHCRGSSVTVRPDRRHGLGGSQQHRGTSGAAPRHRCQRQWPVSPADDRLAWPTISRRWGGSANGYERLLEWALARDRRGQPRWWVGQPTRPSSGVKEGVKGILAPQGPCTPTSASSTSDRSTATTWTPWSWRSGGPNSSAGPMIVHALTQKKRTGFAAAEQQRGT